jgi:hypothetical protein
MNVIDPITITDAMIGAGTSVAEPSASETAWSGSSVAYAVGDVRIRATTHRKYRCAAAHTSAASPTPENDGTRWVDIGPTDRWAPFDQYTSTAVTGTTSITYVLSPGYVNSLALYGLTGAQYSVTVKDAPGGSVIYTRTGYLLDDPIGWYEYLFVPQPTRSKLVFAGIPIRPTAEITVTITAASGQPVGLGMIVVGDYAPLISDAAEWGGVEQGAQAEPVTYSYIKSNDDGTTTIVRRHSATNLRCTVRLPRQHADAAVSLLQSVLDKPVAYIATDAPGYAGLNVFGLATSSPVRYDSFAMASIEITVKGLI